MVKNIKIIVKLGTTSKACKESKISIEKSVSKNAKENRKKFWEYAKPKTKVREGIPDLDINEPDGNILKHRGQHKRMWKRQTLY